MTVTLTFEELTGFPQPSLIEISQHWQPSSSAGFLPSVLPDPDAKMPTGFTRDRFAGRKGRARVWL